MFNLDSELSDKGKFLVSSMIWEFVILKIISFIFSDKLVLVSYNLLGVDNASNHMDLYHNIPPQHLAWSRRKHLICKEISRYNASILCLQASLSYFYLMINIWIFPMRMI